MTYCSTCGYPAPCGRCEDSDNPSARIRGYDPPRLCRETRHSLAREWVCAAPAGHPGAHNWVPPTTRED
jgi:hypothetical protein